MNEGCEMLDEFPGAIGALGVSMDKKLCIMCLWYTVADPSPSMCFHHLSQSAR
jgi:hypothetical protein